MIGHAKKMGFGDNGTFIFAPGSRGIINVNNSTNLEGLNIGEEEEAEGLPGNGKSAGKGKGRGLGQGQGQGEANAKKAEKLAEKIQASKGNGQNKGLYKQAERLGIDLQTGNDEVTLTPQAQASLNPDRPEQQQEQTGIGGLNGEPRQILQKIMEFFIQLLGITDTSDAAADSRTNQ
jgi:hypothetical protein